MKPSGDEMEDYKKYSEKQVRQANWEAMAVESNDQKIKAQLRKHLKAQRIE